MSRLTLQQTFLLNLKQEIPEWDMMSYMTREEAYEALKKHTGQDFGYDIEAWERWFRENEHNPWQGFVSNE
jgi:hypothetical protein